MIPALKKGAALPLPQWPGIETARLILRQWRASDIAANTAMLGDPLSARFITPDRTPVTEPMAGWRNAAIMAGHWALHETVLLGHACDLWVTYRSNWRGSSEI
ncbi:MAG: hypothetical protein DI543_00025 [Bradyrhizobium icense]|jgi:RimJ/RimL family protein N-acetyltransferase|nr:MAG: hypothetical protein DI543_00025 [Bradyrhizobium icense]